MKTRKNVALKNSTWMGVGGFADTLFKPESIQELTEFIKSNNQEITVIGVGSNVLIRDSGIRGVVIRLGKEFNHLSREGNIITARASVLDYQLANFALENSISGFEFFLGIPGTIGGALAMNSGCYGGDTSSILKSATVIDEKGNILNLPKEEIGYVYRGNKLPKSWIFVEAEFIGTQEDKKKIKEKMDNVTTTRNSTQPMKSKTCGSIFKNQDGNKAWKLIDTAGCRGMSIGDAEISHVHCNFVINKGEATAKEIEDLCEKVKEKVKKIHNVELEWEMIRLGS